MTDAAIVAISLARSGQVEALPNLLFFIRIISQLLIVIISFKSFFCYNNGKDANRKVILMTQSLNSAEECDTTCLGSDTDLNTIKAELIDDQAAVQFADWFKAFSDPTRVKLISALLKESCAFMI